MEFLKARVFISRDFKSNLKVFFIFLFLQCNQEYIALYLDLSMEIPNDISQFVHKDSPILMIKNQVAKIGLVHG